MLSGCMIDGFGWFTEADYRRSWLLLDAVDYILPERLAGPLSYDVTSRPDFTIVQPTIFSSELSAAAKSDAEAPFLKEVVSRIPDDDRDYARRVVWCDVEAKSGLVLDAPPSAELSISYLLNKLVLYAQMHGLSPIVGRPYSAELIGWKMRERLTGMPWNKAAARQRVRTAAFAAGLSLDFLSDEDLMHADVDTVVRFKQQHQSLLERSQSAIKDLSTTFESLPDSPQFENELGKLRAAAAQERQELETLGRQAWIDAGLRVTKRGIAAGTAALGGSLVLLSAPLSLVAVTAAVAAAVAPEALDAFEKRMKATPPKFSFLMKAKEAIGS